MIYSCYTCQNCWHAVFAVARMAQTEVSHAFQATPDGQLPDKQMRRATPERLCWRHSGIMVIFSPCA